MLENIILKCDAFFPTTFANNSKMCLIKENEPVSRRMSHQVADKQW